MLRAQGHKMRVQNYNIFTYLPNIQAIFFYFCNCAVTMRMEISKMEAIIRLLHFLDFVT